MHDDLLTPCTLKKGDLATSLALDSDKNDADPPAPRRPMGGMINYFEPPHSTTRRLDTRTSLVSRVSRVQWLHRGRVMPIRYLDLCALCKTRG
jgi:hypothetical protein